MKPDDGIGFVLFSFSAFFPAALSLILDDVDCAGSVCGSSGSGSGQQQVPLYGRLVGEEHLASLAQQAAATSIAVPSDDRGGDRQILQARVPPVVAATVASSLNHRLFRDPATGPLRKLSVDLIKTYKHINEVGSVPVPTIRLRYPRFIHSCFTLSTRRLLARPEFANSLPNVGCTSLSPLSRPRSRFSSFRYALQLSHRIISSFAFFRRCTMRRRSEERSSRTAKTTLIKRNVNSTTTVTTTRITTTSFVRARSFWTVTKSIRSLARDRSDR